MSVESLVTNKVCADCEHEEVCRHKVDYLAFVDAIGEFTERCNGDKISDGVITVNVSCNYYTSIIKPVTKSPF